MRLVLCGTPCHGALPTLFYKVVESELSVRVAAEQEQRGGLRMRGALCAAAMLSERLGQPTSGYDPRFWRAEAKQKSYLKAFLI